MNPMSMIGSMFSVASGDITKAFLCVKNPMSMESKLKSQKAEIEKITKESGNDEAARAKKIEELVNRDPTNMSKAAIEEAKSRMSVKLIKTNLTFTTKLADYLFIELMFNPATIKISSSGGTMVDNDCVGAMNSVGNRSLMKKDQPVTRVLSFTTIIDDTNNDDAFHFSGNTSLTIGNVVGTAMDIIAPKTHSVKTKVEALLGLLSEKVYSDAIFCYGKMVFHGELTTVNARYTMFNKDGNPIRAEVGIELQQLTGGKFSADVAMWNDKFNNAFFPKTL